MKLAVRSNPFVSEISPLVFLWDQNEWLCLFGKLHQRWNVVTGPLQCVEYQVVWGKRFDPRAFQARTKLNKVEQINQIDQIDQNDQIDKIDKI